MKFDIYGDKDGLRSGSMRFTCLAPAAILLSTRFDRNICLSP